MLLPERLLLGDLFRFIQTLGRFSVCVCKRSVQIKGVDKGLIAERDAGWQHGIGHHDFLDWGDGLVSGKIGGF